MTASAVSFASMNMPADQDGWQPRQVQGDRVAGRLVPGYGECQFAVQIGGLVGGVPVPWKPNSTLPPAAILPL